MSSLCFFRASRCKIAALMLRISCCSSGNSRTSCRDTEGGQQGLLTPSVPVCQDDGLRTLPVLVPLSRIRFCSVPMEGIMLRRSPTRSPVCDTFQPSAEPSVPGPAGSEDTNEEGHRCGTSGTTGVRGLTLVMTFCSFLAAPSLRTVRSVSCFLADV